MKTIVLQEPGTLQLTTTVPPAAPGPGEALVAVRRVGICGTDLHAYRGRQPFFNYPRILGHELGVEVLALGSGTDESAVAVGDVCAVEPYLNCGTCVACRAGKTNCCVRLQVLGVHIDGGMREQIVVPVHKLHKANQVPVDQLAMVEMLCIGAHAVRRAALTPGEEVLVVGAGPIGLGVMLFAQLAGARVRGLEVSPQRIDFARTNLDIDHWLDPGADIVAQLHEGDNGPTTVFDATGNANSMHAAFTYPVHGGKLVFVGLVQDDITFADPYFHSHELTLLSSRNATAEDFRTVIEAIGSGRAQVGTWITHHADPAELVSVFPGWLDPAAGVVKAMLDFA